MTESEWLGERFEAHRPRLRSVAYRMLGSLTEADDAVQDAWLRVSRSGGDGIDNFGGWLTTIVARICLNMLRSRNTRESLQPSRFHLPSLARSLAGGFLLTTFARPQAFQESFKAFAAFFTRPVHRPARKNESNSP